MLLHKIFLELALCHINTIYLKNKTKHIFNLPKKL